MRKLDPGQLGAAQEKLVSELRARVIAQDSVLEELAACVQRFRIGLAPPGRPPGIYLLVGPTGSGKSLVARVLAEVVTGKPLVAPLRIDCAEFKASHETARLTGAPPGYLGHRETAPLITGTKLAAQKSDDATPPQRLSFILFDEIDKANESLLDILLGVFDNGTLSTGDGKTVDFTSTMILMTANTGSKAVQQALQPAYGLGGAAGRPPIADGAKAAAAAARRVLRPEFFNRLDKVLVFDALTQRDLRRILDLELEALAARLRISHGLTLRVSDTACDWLAADGFDVRYGGRHLKRAIETHLTLPIANLISSGQLTASRSLEVMLVGDHLEFNG
jgi:ATP-dependent Clp protease ATP-binding subunit ClpB